MLNVSRRAERGVALVITLILLSVTLVMAVAFLAISRRERNSVTTSTATATTRLATDSALAAAQAQIAASVLASNSAAYDYHLFVSTNYVDVYNDYFDVNGNLLPGSQLESAVSNQLVLPRAPVFVSTNAGYPLDFRYYLDLNRNGHFEDSGLVPDVDNTGFTNGFFSATGDPQWIGVLEHPDQFHGPNNRFLSRYAFFAQPIGNSLDLNHIYNQTLNTSLGVNDGFFRNEGVGTWELNLAAFLADLNTNIWNPPTVLNVANNPYNYQQPFFQNTGAAFEDARALLAYRYNNNYNSLAVPLPKMYSALAYAGIDGYTFGPLLTGTGFFTPSPPANTTPWAGSDNTNHFYALMSDLFDPTKSSPNFTNRMAIAGNSAFSQATYDRYTLYRLLDQLGTDSQVDDDRMNLNYDNLDIGGNVVPGAETNLIAWTPLRFFTNAADRLLRYNTARWFAADPTNYLLTYFNYNPSFYIGRDGYGLTNFLSFGTTNEIPSFGLTNIPVYVGGRLYYSPAVNRLLQLAANIYDASTNSFYPSVFRPRFNRLANGDVYIDGFVDVNQAASITLGTRPLDAPVLDITAAALTLNADENAPSANVYGIPWIIGAKKGLPNFNQFYMNNVVQVTRKLQVWRNDAAKTGADGTNQMFVMSITNHLGFSLWNSYDANYVPSGGNLKVYARDIINMTLSNGVGVYPNFYGNPVFAQNVFQTNLSYWPGSGWTLSRQPSPLNQKPQASSFVSGGWDFDYLPESDYQAASASFVPVGSGGWDVGLPTVAPFPQFDLMTTNYIQACILDGSHIIDYVQLGGPNGVRNLSGEIADSRNNPKDVAAINNNTAMWDTNIFGGGVAPTWGVVNQIQVSKYNPAGAITKFWKQPPNMPSALNTPVLESSYFLSFFTGDSFVYRGKLYSNTNKVQQAPYTPTRTAWQYTLWQANDPIVHYLASDLRTTDKQTGTHHADIVANSEWPTPPINAVGDRYQPWGRNAQMSQVTSDKVDSGAYNLRLRDSLVWGSDDWDFPTNKYPTVGWLGRVHRGTPWQTVYLKARDVLSETYTAADGSTQNNGVNTWAQWTGDLQSVNNRYFDSTHSAPLQDTGLFDLFTTRLNDNAVKGALSVNQTHLAAWSALFSGVAALTNTTSSPQPYIVPTTGYRIIAPAGSAGTNSPVGQLVASINATRSAFTNVDGVKGVFERVGDILRVPAYTEQSPFLNTGGDNPSYGISDELYEWLPQQTLGLLRVSSAPRYVVYCYGQTLQPAPNGLVLSGPNFGLCTNYQITAESAARAIVRLDKHVTASGTNYTTTVENYTVLPP